MSRTEQRVKRLEKEAPRGACEHPPIVYLTDPPEKEIEELRKELETCRTCREADVKIVIFKRW